jgi:hypothetical protein
MKTREDHEKYLSQNENLLDQSKRREDHENSISQNKKLLDKSKTKFKRERERKKKLISKYASPKSKIIGGIYQSKNSNKELVDPRSPSTTLSLIPYIPFHPSIFTYLPYHAIGDAFQWTYDDDPFKYSNSWVAQTPFHLKPNGPHSVNIRDHVLAYFIHHIYQPSYLPHTLLILIGYFPQAWLSTQGQSIIIAAYGFGVYQLSIVEGDLFDEPINSIHLKKFYV